MLYNLSISGNKVSTLRIEGFQGFQEQVAKNTKYGNE